MDADGVTARERGWLGDLDNNGRAATGVGRLSSFKEMEDLDGDFVIIRPRSEFLPLLVESTRF